MALFQPTSISPSTIGGEIGNGVVDLNYGLDISWQVNGNSPMIGYKIDIYQNNSASTSVYSTGEIALDSPFYGVDYKGDIQLFAVTIDSSTVSTAGMSNGNEYKMLITQYWGDTQAPSSVVQASASVFIGRDTPSISIDTIDNPVASNAYTFTATYSQAQGDALTWVRWQLAESNNTANPFYDTHNIYGTAQLRLDYDGFFPGTIYVVRCIVQTESGIEIATGWQRFLVQYPVTQTTGFVNAKCVKSKSAVLASFEGLHHVPASTSGTYSIDNGQLILQAGGQVRWNTVNDSPMTIPTPWSVIHKWVARGNVTGALVLYSGGNAILTESLSSGALTINGNTVTTGLTNGAEIVTMITPTTTYVRVTMYSGGLYPQTNLTPSTSLTPVADTPDVVLWNGAISFTQPIESVVLNGPQECDYVQVFTVDTTSMYNEVIANDTYVASYDENTYMLAAFNNSLEAGNVGESASDLMGYDVYRQETGENKLEYVGSASRSAKGVYDYAAANQHEYTYYVFPFDSSGTYLTSPMVSNPITPCWWEWTIIECSDDGIDEENAYQPIALYRFANNIATDAISNNNNPYVANNFTRYPTVQLVQQNYQSGSLGGLIGYVDYENGNEYFDSIALRDAIWGLSTSANTLFLKNRKGDLLQIRISGPITMTTSDATKQQMQTMALPWVEVGSAEEVAIYGNYWGA